MTINAPAAILLAMYIVIAEKQGIAPDRISGTIQNDVLKSDSKVHIYSYTVYEINNRYL